MMLYILKIVVCFVFVMLKAFTKELFQRLLYCSIHNNKTSSEEHSKFSKTKISAKDKAVLENWLEKNRSHPYANHSEFAQLALQTNLSELKIKRWLENKRAKQNMNCGVKHAKCFNEEEKSILKKFYDTKQKHPGPEDLSILENIIKKDQKKIRAWFNNQRYKERKNFQKLIIIFEINVLLKKTVACYLANLTNENLQKKEYTLLNIPAISKHFSK